MKKMMLGVLGLLVVTGCSSQDIPPAHKGRMFAKSGALTGYSGGSGFEGSRRQDPRAREGATGRDVRRRGGEEVKIKIQVHDGVATTYDQAGNVVTGPFDFVAKRLVTRGVEPRAERQGS